MKRFDAVVFDFGGVIITPITAKVAELAERAGVPAEQMLTVLMGPRHESTADHPWHRCERGEVAVADLQRLVAPFAAAAGIELRGDEMDVLLDQSYSYNDHVVDRVAALRGQGFTTGLLTNSVKEYRPTLERELDLSLFDVVVDSSEVGLRKLEPEIYERTTELLGVAPHRVLYLDDFVQNVEGARAAGWTVIHVHGTHDALVALDALLGTTAPTTEDPT